MDVNVEEFLGRFDPGYVILSVFGAIGLVVVISTIWIVMVIRRDILARRRDDLLKKLAQDIAEAEDLPFGHRERAIAKAQTELTEAMLAIGLLVGGSLNLIEGVKLFSPGCLGLVIEEHWLFEFQHRDIREFSRLIAQAIFEAYGHRPECLKVLELMDPSRPARQYLEMHLAELLRVDDRRRQEQKATSAQQKLALEKAKLIRQGFRACGQKLPESLDRYAKPKKSGGWLPVRRPRPALAQVSSKS